MSRFPRATRDRATRVRAEPRAAPRRERRRERRALALQPRRGRPRAGSRRRRASAPRRGARSLRERRRQGRHRLVPDRARERRRQGARGGSHDAAIVLGFARALLERINATNKPFEQHLHDTAFTRLSAALGPAQLEELLATGSRLPAQRGHADRALAWPRERPAERQARLFSEPSAPPLALAPTLSVARQSARPM